MGEVRHVRTSIWLMKHYKDIVKKWNVVDAYKTQEAEVIITHLLRV